jgi:hypothetical protein
MIYGIVKVAVEPEDLLEVRAGTLEIHPASERESATLVAMKRLEKDEAVSLVPLDTTKLTQHGFGVQVAR